MKMILIFMAENWLICAISYYRLNLGKIKYTHPGQVLFVF